MPVELEPGDMLVPLGVEEGVPGLAPLDDVELTEPAAPAPPGDMAPPVDMVLLRLPVRDPDGVEDPLELDMVEPDCPVPLMLVPPVPVPDCMLPLIEEPDCVPPCMDVGDVMPPVEAAPPAELEACPAPAAPAPV